MQHRPRACGTRRRQGTPAQRRVEVVRVDDARARAPDLLCDLLRCESATEQPGRRAGTADRRAVAGQQPRLLAEVPAYEPQQILDRPFLAAGGPVAVVQEQDHPARV